MRAGYELTGAVTSSQMWTAAFTGEYAEPAVAALAPFVRPDTCVLDIGASMGFFTVPGALLSRSVGATLVAYEPVPANVDLVRLNVASNNLAQVVDVRPRALGARAGRLSLAVEGSGAGNAAVTDGVAPGELTHHTSVGGLRSTIVADVGTLDTETLPPCSAIKIDVEGFELDVLRGGDSLIANQRPAIYAEFNPGWLSSRGLGHDAVRAWIDQHGYTPYTFPGSRPRPWREWTVGREPIPARAGWSGDVLLVPN